MRQPLVADGRNMFDPKAMRAAGLRYFCIGRGRDLGEDGKPQG
jgi:UDPglucose 6-dehydrogenase